MADRRITDYIQQQRRTYTKEAIRHMLLQRGYDPAAVEEAFVAVESGQAPPAPTLGWRFWVGYLAYLAALYAALVVVGGILFGGEFGVAALILTPFLALGLIVSVIVAALMAGSIAIRSSGAIVTIAVIPIALILILGGSCLALFSPGFTGVTSGPQSVPATVELEIDPPLAFAGSGGGNCYGGGGGGGDPITSVFSYSIGALEDGRTVSVSIEGYDPGGLATDRSAIVSVSLGTPGASYVSDAVGIPIRLGDDGRSGSAQFTDLPLGTPEVAADLPLTIDGSVSWQCH